MIATRKERRQKRKKNIIGTESRPRMVVFASSLHFYIQVINDEKGHTITQLNTLDKSFSKRLNVNNINEFAEILYTRLKKENISKIVLDKNGFSYAGRLALLADALRVRGIIF